MSLSKTNELIGSSPEGFEAAICGVVARAHVTLRGVTGIRVVAKELRLGSDGSREYRVRLRLRFAMAPGTVLHG